MATDTTRDERNEAPGQEGDHGQDNYEKALTLLEQQRTSEALELLDRCIEASPRDAAILYARAVTHISTGGYRKAGCDLLKSIAINRTLLHAWKQLGYVQFMLGKEDEALKTLKKALEIDPCYAPIYCVLGDIYIDRAQFSEAKEAFDKALELEPEQAEAHSKLAMYYVARGDRKGLKQEYELLKTLDADLAEQIGTLYFYTDHETIS